MTCPYGREVHNVFFVLPTVAIGRMGPVWFVEVAWLYLAIGISFSVEE